MCVCVRECVYVLVCEWISVYVSAHVHMEGSNQHWMSCLRNPSLFHFVV